MQYPTILAGDRITATLLTSIEPLSAVKSADESRTSNATPSNDAELFFACEANAVYQMEGFIKYSGDTQASTVGDINIDWTAPAGSTGEWFGIGLGNAESVTPSIVQMGTQDIEAQRSYGSIGAGTTMGVSLLGTLRTGSTAGTYNFQWAQRVSSAVATVVYADSWIRLTRVG